MKSKLPMEDDASMPPAKKFKVSKKKDTLSVTKKSKTRSLKKSLDGEKQSVGSPSPKKTKVCKNKPKKKKEPKEVSSNDIPDGELKKKSPEKLSKFSKGNKKEPPTALKKIKPKTFGNRGHTQPETTEDWIELKKRKKELKLRRKQDKYGARYGVDVIVRAKTISEELRQKSLRGGEMKRVILVNELHSLLKGKGHYAKFVLAHDTSRIVQLLLKYASEIVVLQISKELIPIIVDMLKVKYSAFCAKCLLKYGNAEVRSQVIDGMLGNVVKLACHSVSTPILEYAYSTWATPDQKRYFVQEFFGDLYRTTKDDCVHHLRDTYKDNKSLKAATLGATKANLLRILNKSLLDSGLAHTVLCQYLVECSEDDRKELITQIAPHVVIISNSKDGARVAMQCIWHGTNKDRKVLMKAMKEHLTDLSKHEHAHRVVITLIDSIDDTVLLNKIILSDLLENAKDLAVTEWGRKVLLWLVAPADTTKFHPFFVDELSQGREASSSKKLAEVRRGEILGYSVPALLELVRSDARFWLSNASLATEMAAFVKAGSGDLLVKVYKSLVEVVMDPEWKVKIRDEEILGIEDSGMHMMLKKLVQHDKINLEKKLPTFGERLAKKLDDDLLPVWLKLNRGCFLLVAVLENGSDETRSVLETKLKGHKQLLRKQSTTGSQILLKKLK